MATKSIRSVHLSIFFGTNASRFEVKADTSLNSSAANARYSGNGIGNEAKEFLADILSKSRAAYGSQSSIALNVDGDQIQPP